MQDHVISHYRLVRKIGAGAFGEVWEGVHVDIEAIRVAVKILHPALSGDETFVGNLKRECATLHTLQHPNIVGFRDLILSGERPAMVMELVEGEDAFTAVGKGKLAPSRVLDVGRDALTGLAFAHEAGVVHRDVKPSNLYLCSNGRSKLLDFGVARAADGSNATKTGTIQGTMQYIAPELFQGAKANAKSDLYALGLTLWELLSGRSACPEGPMFAQMGWHVGEGLIGADSGSLPDAPRDFLLKCCAVDPDARFASASEALEAWNALDAAAEPVESVPSTPPGTVSLDLADLKEPPETAARSLPPESVVLSATEVEERIVEPPAPALPPESVVLSATEVDAKIAESTPPPKPAGAGDAEDDSEPLQSIYSRPLSGGATDLKFGAYRTFTLWILGFAFLALLNLWCFSPISRILQDLSFNWIGYSLHPKFPLYANTVMVPLLFLPLLRLHRTSLSIFQRNVYLTLFASLVLMVLYKWWCGYMYYGYYGYYTGSRWLSVFEIFVGALILFTVQVRSRVECTKAERGFCNKLLFTCGVVMLLLAGVLLMPSGGDSPEIYHGK